MTLNSIDELKTVGFEGFKRTSDLFIDNSLIPKEKGVYLILNLQYKTQSFLQAGTGGFFKGKDPNVSLERLKDNWVDNSLVVYVGQAGGNNSKATLQSRLKQYLNFGQGKNVGHWGGRLIWQLECSSELIVCWKPLVEDDPRNVERGLIKQFVSKFSKRPFANLVN